MNILQSNFFGGENWSAKFATLCWLIWKRRNNFIFEDITETNINLVFKCNSMLVNLSQASKKLSGINLNGLLHTDSFVGW